jgi:1-deoxy-D-xylulose-5-phosphate reductoisomerase
LALAWDVLRAAPGTPAVLNAANEIAVAAFLDGRIRFDQIHKVNAQTLQSASFVSPESLEDLIALDEMARSFAMAAVSQLAN